jgi:hypothetical protein
MPCFPPNKKFLTTDLIRMVWQHVGEIVATDSCLLRLPSVILGRSRHCQAERYAKTDLEKPALH